MLAPFANKEYSEMIAIIPVLLPKWQGGSFTVVKAPYAHREYVSNYGQDVVFASFYADPEKSDTSILYEVYDGEAWYPVGVVVVKTGLLISAGSSGVTSIANIVYANWASLFNSFPSDGSR